MIIHPFAKDPLPLDKCGITTRLQINPDFIHDTEATAARLGIRWYDRGTSYEKQFAKTKSATTTIQLHRYEAVSLFCMKVPRSSAWFAASITLNPAKIIYGHNTRCVGLAQFCQALTIARELIRPVLFDPADSIHIIPGVHPDGLAYWNSLEVRLDLYDLDGRLWHAMRNARCPGVNVPPVRHGEESLKHGNKRCQVALSVYHKDKEKQELCAKYGVAPDPVLRVEVILKGDKLVEKLSRPGNTAVINRRPRVVRFCGADLVRVHQDVVHGLQGCTESRHAAAKLPTNDKMGRMMGMLAAINNTPLEDVLAMYKERFLPSDATYRRMHSDVAGFDAVRATTRNNLTHRNEFMNPAKNETEEAALVPCEIDGPSFQHHVIQHRAGDDYVNATAMCKAHGKLFADYRRLGRTQANLEVLSTDIGIPIALLVQSRATGPYAERGTWVHPLVALNLAQWCSPKFAVWVAGLIYDAMKGQSPVAPVLNMSDRNVALDDLLRQVSARQALRQQLAEMT